MNLATQYRPNYFSGFDQARTSFADDAELKAIPWVARFSKVKDFYRFSMAGDKLMAEYNEGRTWWVVAMIDNPEKIGLPKWIGEAQNA